MGNKHDNRQLKQKNIQADKHTQIVFKRSHLLTHKLQRKAEQTTLYVLIMSLAKDSLSQEADVQRIHHPLKKESKCVVVVRS